MVDKEYNLHQIKHNEIALSLGQLSSHLFFLLSINLNCYFMQTTWWCQISYILKYLHKCWNQSKVMSLKLIYLLAKPMEKRLSLTFLRMLVVVLRLHWAINFDSHLEYKYEKLSITNLSFFSGTLYLLLFTVLRFYLFQSYNTVKVAAFPG